jgi:O-antigen/teichoic acid export membrane protein
MFLSRRVPLLLAGSGYIAAFQNQHASVEALHRYSLPLIGLALVAWFNGMIDRYLIGGSLGLEEAGLYIAAYGLVSRPFLMVAQIVEQTLRQTYYQAVTDGDRSLSETLFRRWLGGVAIGCGFGLLAVITLQQQLATLFLGVAFRSAASLMPWIAAGYSLLALSQVFERRLYAVRRTGQVLLIQTIGAGAMTVLLALWLHDDGLLGAAHAVVGASLLQFVISALVFRAADVLIPERGPGSRR